MREIIFRAKHAHALRHNEQLNGTWVYGYLQDEKHISHPGLAGEFLIDEVTAGQYIGILDKNKKKIYEGDIVFIDGEDEYFTVEWDDDTARFIMSSKTLTVDFGSYWGYQVEVIGNVHENAAFSQMMPKKKRGETRDV